MGADGHITIWKREEALKKFTDADELFALLPNCYRETFDGQDLYHAYHGDGMGSDWRDFNDWAYGGKDYPPLERQREFFNWLRANCGEQWEVWT